MTIPSTYWGEERNRCTITTPDGPIRLTVPLYDARRQQPLEDVRICYMHSWQRQHWSAICSAYGKTPYFDYYADFIRPLYEKHPVFLADLNEETAYLLHCLSHNCWPGEPVAVESPLLGKALLDRLFAYGPEMLLKH